MLARNFSRATAERSKKRYKTKKGDISIEVRKGTFLKSFDNVSAVSLTCHQLQPKMCPNGGVPIIDRAKRLSLPRSGETRWWRHGRRLQSGGHFAGTLCGLEIPAGKP